jgi:hypothetical protein
MTIQTLEEKPVFKFYIPSLTREKQPISPENQKAYIDTIQFRAAKQNGGFTKYNARGGYLANDGSMIHEPIILIETYGENPLTDSELSGFCKLLDQEVLMVHESGISRAFMYDGDIKEAIDFYEEVIPEGEIIRYYKEPVPYGKGYKILMEILDELGNTTYCGKVSERDLCQMVYEENQSAITMMKQFGISL